MLYLLNLKRSEEEVSRLTGSLFSTLGKKQTDCGCRAMGARSVSISRVMEEGENGDERGRGRA